jgi:serine phosphatase RsbU (regulator of sigma subunit)
MHWPAAASGVAEGEGRSAWSGRERDSARRVQEYLLPGRGARLAGLDSAACAVPAGAVGGDYYDFIRLSPRRLALAVGDVSGKGVAAALLTAALQASLRSHYAVGGGDLAARLQSVNRLFHDSTAEGRFATLFVGEYDDRTACLRYANCGHPPALLLRADGSLARLEATATVLGITLAWPCAVGQTRLGMGDTLLVYSDGATEARRADGEEFGEERLAAALGEGARLPLPALLEHVTGRVRAFCGGGPGDDLTLVAVRARRAPGAVALEPRPGRRGVGRAG